MFRHWCCLLEKRLCDFFLKGCYYLSIPPWEKNRNHSKLTDFFLTTKPFFLPSLFEC